MGGVCVWVGVFVLIFVWLPGADAAEATMLELGINPEMYNAAVSADHAA